MEGREMSALTRDQVFDEWVETLGLKHFKPWELRFLGGGHYDHRSKGYGLNRLPAKTLWANIVPVIRAADKIREIVHQPVVILSAYRSPAYNAAIGGAKFSQHLQFRALDLAVPGQGIVYLRQAARDLRRAGWFTGGIGTYKTFIHIDNRGANVDF